MSDRIICVVEPIAAVLGTAVVGFLAGLVLVVFMEKILGRTYFWGMF